VAKPAKKIPPAAHVAEDLLWGGWNTCTIAAAVELDVFTAISSGKVTAAAIAHAASADETMLRRLLDALVALKYLTRKGDRYALTPASATYLVRGSDLYMEGGGRFSAGQMMGWFQLADVIRRGAPLARPGGPEAAGEFFAMLVKVIFPFSNAAARELIGRMTPAARARIKSVLDVGGGAAAWSIPFAQKNRATRVTVLDMPQVTPVTRQYAERFGVARQYDYRDGDLREADLGKAQYDLVILGHIIHGEGREAGQRLIARCAEALRDRGTLLIAEFIPNDDRSGPPLAMLFGLNMMLHVPEGDVFTMKEYRGWLKAAGFRTIKAIRTPSAPSPLILATK
jgi:2-polyprenyl-3-methyl-5-hydroxy-6-metoxy-1,4-benzoquinol methylase